MPTQSGIVAYVVDSPSSGQVEIRHAATAGPIGAIAGAACELLWWGLQGCSGANNPSCHLQVLGFNPPLDWLLTLKWFLNSQISTLILAAETGFTPWFSSLGM